MATRPILTVINHWPEGSNRALIILEPEGLDTEEIYASGLGNSLPMEVQIQVVRRVQSSLLSWTS